MSVALDSTQKTQLRNINADLQKKILLLLENSIRTSMSDPQLQVKSTLKHRLSQLWQKPPQGNAPAAPAQPLPDDLNPLKKISAYAKMPPAKVRSKFLSKLMIGKSRQEPETHESVRLLTQGDEAVDDLTGKLDIEVPADLTAETDEKVIQGLLNTLESIVTHSKKVIHTKESKSEMTE